MKIKILTLLLFTAFFASAEDIIVLRDGSIIKAIVSDIGISEICYKKVANPTGPTYHIDKSEVLAINYENGEKDLFEKQVTRTNAPNQQYIKATASNDNDSLIAIYNKSTLKHKKKTPNEKKLKLTDIAVVNFGVTPSSILSDENISVSIEVNDTWYETKDGYWGNPKPIGDAWYYYNYKICVYNKTENIIYVDVANSFRIFPNGEAESFYNGITVSNTSDKNSGVGLNLGAVSNALGIGGIIGTLSSGISVGGGKASSTSISENEELIISIPPHAKVAMPAKIYMNDKKDHSAKNYEIFDCSVIANHPKIEKWAYISLGNKYITNSQNYVITYSTSKQFETYSSISFGIFPRGLLGIGGVDALTNYNDYITMDGPILKNDVIEINQKK